MLQPFLRFIIAPCLPCFFLGSIGKAIGGIAKGVGSFLGGGGGALLGGAAQGAASYASSREQMEHQKEMYKHRHQWEVEDLRKAGLNPILSSKFGGQPIGSGAGFQIPNLGEALQAGGVRRVQKELISSQADKAQAEATSAQAQASIDSATAKAMMNDPSLVEARARQQAGVHPMASTSETYLERGRKGAETIASSVREIMENYQNSSRVKHQLYVNMERDLAKAPAELKKIYYTNVKVRNARTLSEKLRVWEDARFLYNRTRNNNKN